MKPNPISLGRKALVQHLQSITAANGYSTNAGHNVKTGWVNEVMETEKENLPLICIQKGKDLAPKPGPDGLIKYSGFSVVGVISALSPTTKTPSTTWSATCCLHCRPLAAPASAGCQLASPASR